MYNSCFLFNFKYTNDSLYTRYYDYDIIIIHKMYEYETNKAKLLTTH